LIVLVVGIGAYLFGRYQQQVVALNEQVAEQRTRAELAEQRLADVLAVSLPAGYGRAIGAKDKIRDTYQAEQDALLRATFNSD
jgi:hypothetical protein